MFIYIINSSRIKKYPVLNIGDLLNDWIVLFNNPLKESYDSEGFLKQLILLNVKDRYK